MKHINDKHALPSQPPVTARRIRICGYAGSTRRTAFPASTAPPVTPVWAAMWTQMLRTRRRKKTGWVKPPFSTPLFRSHFIALPRSFCPWICCLCCTISHLPHWAVQCLGCLCLSYTNGPQDIALDMTFFFLNEERLYVKCYHFGLSSLCFWSVAFFRNRIVNCVFTYLISLSTGHTDMYVSLEVRTRVWLASIIPRTTGVKVPAMASLCQPQDLNS